MASKGRKRVNKVMRARTRFVKDLLKGQNFGRLEIAIAGEMACKLITGKKEAA